MEGVDPLLLCSVGFLLTALTFIIARIAKLHIDEKNARRRTEAILAMAREEDKRNEREAIVVGGRRRIGARRRVLHDGDEMGFAVAAASNLASGSDQDEEGPLFKETVNAEEHIGRKKMAKLQAKAERKAQREAELLEREERKKRERELEELKEAEREKERLQEEAEKERKRIEEEEKKKREEEEYQKMKEAFEVSEEGFDQLEGEEAANLMRDFVEYVKKCKVVNMDELGAHFKLRTEEAIDRLNYFIQNGTLTGVMDDRGKFIYITPDELHAAYRHPASNVQDSSVFLEAIADWYSVQYPSIVVGDFSYDVLPSNADRHFSSMFDLFLLNSSLFMLNTEPTRGNYVLDLLLCNDLNLISEWDVLPNFSTSDHCSLSFNILYDSQTIVSTPTLDFRKTDWAKVNLLLMTVDLDTFENTTVLMKFIKSFCLTCIS